MFIMRKTRYVFVYLHKTKDEISTVFAQFMAAVGDEHKPKTIRCDCAGEYVSPKFRQILSEKYNMTMQNSNAYQQHQNGICEKVGDTLGQRMRAGMLHSALPSQFWGAAIIMAADVYNATQHRAFEDKDTPYHCQFRYHAHMDHFRPFGC